MIRIMSFSLTRFAVNLRMALRRWSYTRLCCPANWIIGADSLDRIPKFYNHLRMNYNYVHFKKVYEL